MFSLYKKRAHYLRVRSNNPSEEGVIIVNNK